MQMKVKTDERRLLIVAVRTISKICRPALPESRSPAETIEHRAMPSYPAGMEGEGGTAIQTDTARGIQRWQAGLVYNTTRMYVAGKALQGSVA